MPDVTVSFGDRSDWRRGTKRRRPKVGKRRDVSGARGFRHVSGRRRAEPDAFVDPHRKRNQLLTGGRYA